MWSEVRRVARDGVSIFVLFALKQSGLIISLSVASQKLKRETRAEGERGERCSLKSTRGGQSSYNTLC